MWPFKKRAKYGGEIYRHGLDEWWDEVFTPQERARISEIYQPLGGGLNSLDAGNSTRQPELSTSSFLANLATWLNKPGTGDLALRVAQKAKSLIENDDGWGERFCYDNLCKVFYRWREDDPQNLADAIWACERSIALSKSKNPDWGDGIRVSHYCYKQLAIIEEKRGDLTRAIELSAQAKAQGWSGDWDKRIARLEKKRAREKR